jgi:hypothetical protein
MATVAPQSRTIPELFHENPISSFDLSLLPVFCDQRVFYMLANIVEYLRIEEWQLKLLNLERFQTFSTQITLEAPFFIVFF